MLDVRRSPELQAAILTMKRANKVARTEINKEARSRVNPLWRDALAARARTSLERRIILPGARVAVGPDRVTLFAATSKRALSNGLVPSEDWAGSEFGMRTREARFTRRDRPVSVWVGRQFRSRQKDGRIAFDAASEVGTEIVAQWVAALVDTLREAPFEVR